MRLKGTYINKYNCNKNKEQREKEKKKEALHKNKIQNQLNFFFFNIQPF